MPASLSGPHPFLLHPLSGICENSTLFLYFTFCFVGFVYLFSCGLFIFVWLWGFLFVLVFLVGFLFFFQEKTYCL